MASQPFHAILNHWANAADRRAGPEQPSVRLPGPGDSSLLSVSRQPAELLRVGPELLERADRVLELAFARVFSGLRRTRLLLLLVENELKKLVLGRLTLGHLLPK